ncbi:hypothetical protein [uncultured Campylobacter sp.]|uniref:hypothetical protein n=1 Tax=uncultured Campylobacter sp. TaxID=218934 RepID=UPI002611D8FC|nr:hypothetical protein [uncultured Campylobacter sp.]
MNTKLDFSSVVWNFSLVENNPIYKAFDSKLEYKSKDDLEELSKNLEAQNISNEAKKANSNLKEVFFRDPITNKIVKSALSENTLSILRENFAGVHKTSSNSYILSDKAESFVSAWYADIAYQRGYIKADADSNGFLTKSELDETRSGYMTHGYFGYTGNGVVTAVINLSTESYIKLGGYSTPYASNEANQVFKEDQKTFYNNGKFAKETIALELERTIQSDKDLNGVLEYKELMSFAEMKQQAMDNTEYEAKDFGSFKEFMSYKDFIDFLLKEGLEKLQVLEKLKEKGYESLNKDEKEYLLKTYPNLFNENKEFKKEDFDSFYEDFKTDFVEKSKDFLGLKDDENLDLNFDELSLVMKEIFSNIASVNISNPFYEKRFVDLEV